MSTLYPGQVLPGSVSSMSNNAFWVLQFVVGAVVAIIVMNEPSLNKALIGSATGIPKWVSLVNPKVEFI